FGSEAEEGGDAERRRPTTTPEAKPHDAGSPLAIVHQAVRAAAGPSRAIPRTGPSRLSPTAQWIDVGAALCSAPDLRAAVEDDAFLRLGFGGS
ncbi:hypothetical protein ACFCYL_27580, partial [Streptomyces sp. NPDC056305]|uniref:hypothetical protein n=2 Tax=Streptomyces TaxID=1883 RepID=UPI0035D71B42